MHKTFIWFVLMFTCISNSFAANVLYIHGDVAADGTVPSGSAPAYDQMLLNDTGNTGLSIFRGVVQSAGHTISQRYDRVTSLTPSLLNNYDVVIFGLHQKIWSSAEKNALDAWLRAGGGMLIYSDSASGGLFRTVGAQNPVGQMVTNNLIAQYGMQVTVDQANGTFREIASSTASIASIRSRVIEGEGVSPVMVTPGDSSVEVLIGYTHALPHTQNLTIPTTIRAALALKTLAQGHIAVMFDRQPMWNNGPGSDIEEEDNKLILRSLVNFLALRPAPPVPPSPRPVNANASVVPAVTLLLDE